MSDGDHRSRQDIVVITVEAENKTPIARAGADQTVSVGSNVTLDGGDSSDPEGQALSYAWEIVQEPEEGAGAALVTGGAGPALLLLEDEEAPPPRGGAPEPAPSPGPRSRALSS